MESEQNHPKTLFIRHKCFACYKQFKKKAHLVEHMKISYHSVHQPRCGVCLKHCKSFESLRAHLNGLLPKGNCSKIFSEQGCDLCLKVFDGPNSLSGHKETCRLAAPAPLGKLLAPHMEYQINNPQPANENPPDGHQKAIAVDCEMVGGGSDGSLNLCARVCLVDEDENLIFHTYVQQEYSVTDYRYEATGITEEHLKDAMPLREVQNKILEILYNGESIGRARLEGGRARLLVGHGLKHDLDCMGIEYPGHLLRDTAKYRPLMKTNLVSHSLKYLTRIYLGYDIQSGTHDPYEDCTSVMRLYKRMRALDHCREGIETQNITKSFDLFKPEELEKMNPEELYKISRSDYKCWCLDQSTH